MSSKKKVLLLDAFHGGSHRQLVDFLLGEVLGGDGVSVTALTLPAKKWHWRSRTAALHLSRHPDLGRNQEFDTLLATSVLNLAEFVALRPDLSFKKKILYFHENQLNYPKREKLERDFQFGYNQITSCLAADIVVFNSAFNKDSFVNSINSLLRLQPDCHEYIREVPSEVAAKCQVILFPVHLPPALKSSHRSDEVLHILWPHRWEHDKNPAAFFAALARLRAEDGLDFRVSVLGERFSEEPEEFARAKEDLGGCIARWGYLESKEEYWKALAETHVVVSTANHEYFGVAMAEAALSGCYPLVPNRLVYPELYPKECLYNTDQQLYKRLKSFCRRPSSTRNPELMAQLKATLHTAPKSKQAFASLLLS